MSEEEKKGEATTAENSKSNWIADIFGKGDALRRAMALFLFVIVTLIAAAWIVGRYLIPVYTCNFEDVSFSKEGNSTVLTFKNSNKLYSFYVVNPNRVLNATGIQIHPNQTIKIDADGLISTDKFLSKTIKDKFSSTGIGEDDTLYQFIENYLSLRISSSWRDPDGNLTYYDAGNAPGIEDGLSIKSKVLKSGNWGELLCFFVDKKWVDAKQKIETDPLVEEMMEGKIPVFRLGSQCEITIDKDYAFSTCDTSKIPTSRIEGKYLCFTINDCIPDSVMSQMPFFSWSMGFENPGLVGRCFKLPLWCGSQIAADRLLCKLLENTHQCCSTYVEEYPQVLKAYMRDSLLHCEINSTKNFCKSWIKTALDSLGPVLPLENREKNYDSIVDYFTAIDPQERIYRNRPHIIDVNTALKTIKTYCSNGSKIESFNPDISSFLAQLKQKDSAVLSLILNNKGKEDVQTASAFFAGHRSSAVNNFVLSVRQDIIELARYYAMRPRTRKQCYYLDNTGYFTLGITVYNK